MSNSYNIKVTDKSGELIGEMMTASPEDVRRFTQKGFNVINVETGESITEQTIIDGLGVSDGCIL
jgi:hypothetical protein